MSLFLLLEDLYDHLFEFAVQSTLLVFVIHAIYHVYHSFVNFTALKHQPHLSQKFCFDLRRLYLIHARFL